jgi:5-methylcytosine-specific restriction endonuclease McrA
MIAKPEPRARIKARLRRLAQKQRSQVMQAVDLRDEGQCRICQCQTLEFHLPRQPHHHHIVYRSQGGLDTPENIILICALCHDKVHRSGKLRLSGDASALMIERFIDGGWINDNERNESNFE